MQINCLILFYSILIVNNCLGRLLIDKNCEILQDKDWDIDWVNEFEREKIGAGGNATVYKYTSKANPKCVYAVKETTNLIINRYFLKEEHFVMEKMHKIHYFNKSYGFFEKIINGVPTGLLFMELSEGINLLEWKNSVCPLFFYSSFNTQSKRFSLYQLN